ncbi:hypothetical protein BsWGS_11034 [Bradybaena similaris]
MTQRSLEKHVRDLRNCILAIQHTTPGLTSFRRPDTSHVKWTNAWKQRAEYNNDLRIKEDVLPQRQLNHSQIEVRNKNENKSVWDCPREELIGACSSHMMKATEDNCESMCPSGIVCDGSNSPKYGRSANTVRDEAWRINVLSRFEAIFDLHKEQAKLHTNRPKTSDSSFTNREATDAAKLSEGLSRRRRAVQTRLTWSAHSRSKLGSSDAETVPESLNREAANDVGLLCATETSRVLQQTLAPVESAILSSHAPAGQQLLKKLKRPNTAPPKCQLPARAVCVSRQQIAGFHADIHSRNADIHSRNADIHSRNADIHSRNADIHSRNADIHSRNADIHSRNADIHSRNADIHSRNADIHSRNADIQAILKKSKQLQEAVQMLISEEETTEVYGCSPHQLSNSATTDIYE